MQINIIIKEAHENAVSKGFWEDWNILSIIAESRFNNDYKAELAKMAENALISKSLMLITSELAEAQEALRKNDTENFAEELADVLIRLADLAGGLGIDLDTEIRKKMDKNRSRPYKHGKKF